MRDWHERVIKVVASRYFFWGVLSLFALEALWFAFTFRHPMLFDESYHLGLIDLYSRQFNPFIGQQAVSADQFGDVVHYPSFLYHYLMSFPYRAVHGLTDNLMVQVIAMRAINIGMMVFGLWMFQKVLRRLRLSAGLSNLVLLLFSLLPIVPMLSAQINYDNLLFPLVALSLYLALRVMSAQRPNFMLTSSLIFVNLLASMVKYTFLPVFAAEVIFLIAYFYRRYRQRNTHSSKFALKRPIRNLLSGLAASFRANKPLPRTLVVVGLVVAAGMFGYRYGGNVVEYGTPSPECNQVLSAGRCQAYGPWARNNELVKQAEVHGVSSNPVLFTITWFKVVYNDFFRVAANRFPDNQPEYSTILPIVRLAVSVIILASLVAIARHWREIYSSPAMRLMVSVIVLYVAVLWLQNYLDFLHTGERVGTQGRYILPLLLPVGAVFAFVLNKSLHDKKLIKAGLAVVSIPLFLQGGGMFAGIVAGQPSWYWQNNTVIHQNENLQKVIRPLVRTKLF